MLEVNAKSILSGIESFLAQAGRAITDNDTQAAINSLNDARNAMQTLTGILGLPPTCQLPEGKQNNENEGTT